MTNCYTYLRFSTPRQERGSSKDRQLDDCRAFIARKGWTEGGVVEDLGRSAWKGVHLKSGNLGKFAQRIFDGDVEPGVLVVENLDRLSRQKPRITQRWMEDICERGWKIASVKGNKVYDAESLEDNIMDILDVLYQGKAANDYVETLSVRSKGSYRDRLKAARVDNTAVHSVGPAWLQAVGKRPNIVWEPISDRVRLIREIFDMTVAGKPPWSIAREFNEGGDCPSFTGKLWERTAIVKIIRNPAVEGDRVIGEGKNSTPTGEVLRGYYGDPIVPLDVVAQARAMLDRRRRGKGRNSGAINNLFGQKIRCGDCKGRMMLMGYKSSYLTCYEAQRGSGCINKTTYKYRPFEAAALDSILHLALDETFFRQAEKSNHIGAEIAGVEKALRDKAAEADRLIAMCRRIDSPRTEAAVVVIEGEIAALNAKLVDLVDKHAQAKGAADAEVHLRRVHGVREALGHPDDHVRLPARLRVSEALQSVVDWIDCREYVGRGKVFYAGLIGGAHSLWFDNEGSLIDEVQPHADCTPEDIIINVDPPELRRRIREYVRRRKA